MADNGNTYGGKTMKEERITLRITESEKEAIKALAQKRDIPVSQLVREVLRDYIKEAARNGV